MSSQPMAFLGQPSCSARDFHMAMTTGEVTRILLGDTSGPSPFFFDVASPIFRYASDAGLTRWAGPALLSLYLDGRALRMSSISSPEPIGRAVTWMTFPLLVRCLF